jgi:hypothetical protein
MALVGVELDVVHLLEHGCEARGTVDLGTDVGPHLSSRAVFEGDVVVVEMFLDEGEAEEYVLGTFEGTVALVEYSDSGQVVLIDDGRTGLRESKMSEETAEPEDICDCGRHGSEFGLGRRGSDELDFCTLDGDGSTTKSSKETVVTTAITVNTVRGVDVHSEAYITRRGAEYEFGLELSHKIADDAVAVLQVICSRGGHAGSK